MKTGFFTLFWLMRLRRLLPAALAAWVLALPAAATSADFGRAQEKSVRSVIEAQLAALAKNDAVKAFSYAAPNVRRAVGSPDAFLAMVQRGYPVVYRPASVAFLKAEGKGSQAIQRVLMVDGEGEAWLATYSLEQQKDRSWRITGCNVVVHKGRMA